MTDRSGDMNKKLCLYSVTVAKSTVMPGTDSVTVFAYSFAEAEAQALGFTGCKDGVATAIKRYHINEGVNEFGSSLYSFWYDRWLKRDQKCQDKRDKKKSGKAAI